ncbi:MAG TPA: hypothetical protein G4O07_09725 [Dehalococcoidia bacterium]|nr:hypothetical protein [Dehalococcoidia bacterium]
MRLFVCFLGGMMCCGAIAFGMFALQPVGAHEDGFGLAELLPDFEKIYQNALTFPLEKAGEKIYNDDILEFYQGLLDSCGINGSTTE